MSVSRDYELDRAFTCFFYPAWLKIQSLRVSVDFYRCLRFGDHVQYFFHSTGYRWAALHQSSERMTPDFEMWVPHGCNYALGRFILIQFVAAMNAGNNYIEFIKYSIWIIQCSVAKNV